METGLEGREIEKVRIHDIAHRKAKKYEINFIIIEASRRDCSGDTWHNDARRRVDRRADPSLSFSIIKRSTHCL